MRIPLWIEASRLKVLIFGGGSVGSRRAKFFHNAGASVRVLARDVSPELQQLGVEVRRVDLRQYDPREDIAWADVVVIAVDDADLASTLFHIAESMGKLVNDATDASRTHIVVPYEKSIDGLRVAVTSEGAAGTPARLSLDVVERCIKESWVPTFYKVYSELKKEAKKYVSETRKRLKFYQELCEDREFMNYVKSKNSEAALARGREILKRYVEKTRADG
ncbi:MAG: bifunctional precorrin-2 dehydrogenase/sirohydrochlorin ferrochelatase [Pyrobaculum sp.]